MGLRLVQEGRTARERALDDERAELELCGLVEDDRELTECRELDARHYDFIFLPEGFVAGRRGSPPPRGGGPAGGRTA